MQGDGGRPKSIWLMVYYIYIYITKRIKVDGGVSVSFSGCRLEFPPPPLPLCATVPGDVLRQRRNFGAMICPVYVCTCTATRMWCSRKSGEN